MALALSLIDPPHNVSIFIRDITQAYLQSAIKLNCTILAKLPPQLVKLYNLGIIIVVIKLLYDIAEAGTHWWATYNQHHKDKLGMIASIYNLCLLISDRGLFGVIGMQTDNTFILGNQDFNNIKQHKIIFQYKKKTKLTKGTSISFNRCIATQGQDNGISIIQKEQEKKLLLINITGDLLKQY